MNLTEKIQSQFDNNENLRVLFFFDKEKEYTDEVKSLEISEIEIIDAEKTHFSLKIKLEYELFDKKVMLYFPYDKPKTSKEKKNFILLDILIANKELLLDDVADFMDEFKLMPHQRKIVKTYIKELKLKKHQKVLTEYLNPHVFSESNVIKGLICCYLEFPTIKHQTLCLAKLLTLTLPNNEEKYTQFEKKLDVDNVSETIARWLFEYLEIFTGTISKDVLITAVRKLKYNTLTQHLPELKHEDQYRKLRAKEGFTLQRINSLMMDWDNDPNLKQEINLVFSITGQPVQEKKLVELYGSDSGYMFFTDELKVLILAENIIILKQHPHKVSETLQTLSVGENDKEELIILVRYLGYAAQYFHYLNGVKSYVLDKPEEYISKYADLFSQIDFSYRKAVALLQDLEKLTLPEVINLNELNKSLHQSYEEYLIELNRQWMNCMEQFSFKFNDISITKQYEFYGEYVKDSDQKVAVIISDSLRYESAVELLGELLGDPKGNARISPVIAGIPSITKWGMANLLSDETLTYKDTTLSVNGLSTEGITNRQKILKSHTRGAVAIQYEKLNQMDQDDARDLFKKSLVYIYHNVIDAIGDDRKSEMKTFDAVDTAISDLKNLVKKVHSSFNVSRVIITSDHGFLFNYRKLSESTFQQKPSGKHIEEHNRYLITKDTKAVTNSYLMNLSDTANVVSDLKIAVPKTINRYKRQGSGMHFVHGGSSLQELVIPVIESNRKREDVSERVPFIILNEEFKIVSGAIKIRILQKQPVGEKSKAREVVAGIYTTVNELVSNEVTHIMDSPSQLATERTKEFILNLSSQAGQNEILVLKIFDLDDNDRLNPLVSDKVFNKTLIESDF